jgi:hypothetical protein
MADPDAMVREFLDFLLDYGLSDMTPAETGVQPARWACPDGCCATCAEEDGGVRCPVCLEKFSWAVLQASDCDD